MRADLDPPVLTVDAKGIDQLIGTPGEHLPARYDPVQFAIIWSVPLGDGFGRDIGGLDPQDPGEKELRRIAIGLSPASGNLHGVGDLVRGLGTGWVVAVHGMTSKRPGRGAFPMPQHDVGTGIGAVR